MNPGRRVLRLFRDHLNRVRLRKRLEKFRSSGQKPWTTGYDDFKKMFIAGTLQDKDLLDRFSHDMLMPLNYGFRLDERVVEYPWLFSRLENANRLLLDAGSALNFPYLLDLSFLKTRNVVIYNLSPESVLSHRNISYIYGDLRQTILKSECFDEIVCISTLEHIGMDNTALYSTDNNFAEFRPNDYQTAIKEFYRLLKPQGRLFITVPYGRHANHGWLQVFDEGMVDNITQVFNGSNVSKVYYQYLPEGWQISTADECAQCEYFDIRSQPHYDPDYAAAARAVICMELVK